jgi:nucleoside-diphosphate kinase
MDRTLVLLKPDCVDRQLVGEVVSRFEKKGLVIAAMKMVQLDKGTAGKHYEMHKGKAFYASLIEYITSGPLIAMVLESPQVVSIVRTLLGATDGAKALPGTLRGDYSMCLRYNLVHASDSRESAEREIAIFFRPDEIIEERRQPCWQRMPDQEWT